MLVLAVVGYSHGLQISQDACLLSWAGAQVIKFTSQIDGWIQKLHCEGLTTLETNCSSNSRQ